MRQHGWFRPHVRGLTAISSTTLREGGGWWIPGSQLDLDFANNRAFNRSTGFNGSPNSILTYTSPSPKMVYGDDGVLRYAPHNAFTYSEQFDNAAWVKSIGGTGVNASVTANAAEAPDGTVTADRVQFDLGGGTTSSDFTLLRQSKQVGAGKTVTMGIWLKSYDSNSYNMILTQPDGNGTAITVTPTWQLFDISGVESAVSAVSYGLRLRGGQTPVNSNTADVLMWGAQINLGATLFDYIPTTTAAVYSLPIDHDPITFEPLGVLIEEQRTNLLTYADDLSNAVWQKANLTLASNDAVAPDGTTTADKITANAGLATHQVYKASGLTLTAAAYTYAVFLKQDTHSKVMLTFATAAFAFGAGVPVDLSAGTIGTIVNYGGHTGATAAISTLPDGWYRVSITINAGAAVYFGAVTITDATYATNWNAAGTESVYHWGAQEELGAFPTSYIPTVASQVTRAADQVTYPLASFSWSSAAGTVLWTGDLGQQVETSTRSLVVTDSNGRLLYSIGNSIKSYDGTTTLSYPTAITIKTEFSVAESYGDSFNSMSIDGGAVASAAFDGSMTTTTNLQIGWGVGTQMFGHIKRLTYWNTRKTDAELQALSA